MKRLLLTFFQISLSTVFAQKVVVSTMDDLCVMSRYVHFSHLPGDLLHIRKDSIPNLVKLLQHCSPQYHYSSHFTDRVFELSIPSYLTKFGNGYGDENFDFYFYDEGDKVAKIVFSYDFTGKYRSWFMAHIHEPERKASEKSINGLSIWAFRNFDDQYAGIVFLSNNLYIAYYTTQASRIPDLEKALVTFKWD